MNDDNNANDVVTWDCAEADDFEATVWLRFRRQTDGMMLRFAAQSEQVELELGAQQGSLVLDSPNDHIRLDMEDTYGILLGGEHTVALTFGGFGIRVYLDGYQCFACATNLNPARFGERSAVRTNSGVYLLGVHSGAETSEQIAVQVAASVPDVEFAAATIADFDVERMEDVHNGTIFAHFRTRGIGQFGTVLAAAGDDGETMNVYVDDDGIRYTFRDGEQRYEYSARGSWTDGNWHDLVIRAFRGAIDLYVDGYLELHQPGQLFFDAVHGLRKISVGADNTGVRLCGEVRNGGIFARPLTDGEIKTLSGVPPTTDTALFDAGYEGAASYRIPSMITTANGVVIAGADQRVVIPNDAPTEIHLVIRRSLDSGRTWLPMQTIVAFPEHGMDAPCVTDSCLTYDREHRRVIVLIDHFPGGRGFANAEQGVGLDDHGRLLVHDRDGAVFTVQEDGSVTGADGSVSDYRIDEQGDVTVNGAPAGNIFAKESDDAGQSLLTARTSYLMELHSDDDGATWSKPRFISQMVKEPWMRFMGVSPGNGIQLSQPPYRGRILVPYYCNGTDPKHCIGGVLISDDGGETWSRGVPINEGREMNGEIVHEQTLHDDDADTYESTIVESADGAVTVLYRNQNHAGRVGRSVSRDGGQTWDELEFVESMPEIFSQPNAITLPPSDDDGAWQPGEASDRMVFANASQMRPYRGRGVLRVSDDGGRTWLRHRCFNPYHYVYQCMSVLPDGELGLLWERETAGVYFTRLPLTWLP